MERSDALDVLGTFPDSLYECFERRADALFELTDSILTAGVVPSPVHLSLQPSHRRGCGSLYAALQFRYSNGNRGVFRGRFVPRYDAELHRRTRG